MRFSEDFLESFHNLEGGTTGKKKESLNKLLKKYSTPEQKTSVDINLIKPKTFLEEVFKIDVLIHFHKTAELLEVLKSDNDIFINKIIKETWFLNEVFCALDPKQLVNDYLPCLSFSTRMKILKRLANILKELDEVFESLMERYGLSIATTVLSSCSTNKIKTVLRDHQLKLSTGQLKKLFKKDPQLILTYLEEYKMPSNKEYKDQKFLTYIAQKDPEYFWKICENYKCNIRVGSKTTKKILQMREDKLVNDPTKYLKYFRQDKMVRILGKKNLFKKLFGNTFPKTKVEIENSCGDSVLVKRLLNYYPKYGRYFLFERTFEEILGDNIWQNIKLVEDDLLTFLKDPELREKLASEKYKKTKDVKYLKYFKIENSVTAIKEKINATSSGKERAKLIELLIETCNINNDLVALEEVLKYFNNRHRHDDEATRESCLSKIEDAYKNQLDKFTDNHWKCINEIFAIQRINNEFVRGNTLMKVKHLEFLFKNNSKEALKSAIDLHLKDLHHVYSAGAFDKMNGVKNPEFEKTVYEYVMDIYPTLGKDKDEDHVKSQCASLLQDVVRHNSKYPNHKIDVLGNETLRNYILDACTKFEHVQYNVVELVEKLICKTNRNDFENELMHLYFQRILEHCSYGQAEVIAWFAKHEPEILETYAKSAFRSESQFDLLMWNKIKRNHHTDLERKLISTLKDQLKNDDLRIQKKIVISRGLAILMPPQKYLEFCKEEVPEASVKLDLDNQELKAKYTFGRELIANLRYSLEPGKQLPLILQYCTPDYMQTTLPALYSAFCRTPENALLFYISELENKKNNSILKHSVFLSAIVCTKSQNVAMYYKFSKNTNSEIFKNFARSSLKYFVRNPCYVTSAVASEFLSGLKSNDEETFQLIISLRLPKMYKTAIISKCWDIFEKLRKEDKTDIIDYDKYQFELINSLDITLNESLETFCKRVIQEYFLKSDETCSSFSGISQFVVKFLASPDIQKQHYDFVFSIIQDFKSNNWSQNREKIKFVHHFFDVFYKNVEDEYDNLTNNTMLTEFKKHWISIFSPIEALDEYILLNLIMLKKENSDVKFLDSYGKSMFKFFNKLFKDYDGTIFNRLAKNVNKFMENASINEKINLYYIIVEENLHIIHDNRNLIFVLIINLMFNVDKSALDVKSQTYYSKIRLILDCVDDDIVKLHYNLYLKGAT